MSEGRILLRVSIISEINCVTLCHLFSVIHPMLHNSITYFIYVPRTKVDSDFTMSVPQFLKKR